MIVVEESMYTAVILGPQLSASDPRQDGLDARGMSVIKRTRALLDHGSSYLRDSGTLLILSRNSVCTQNAVR